MPMRMLHEEEGALDGVSSLFDRDAIYIFSKRVASISAPHSRETLILPALELYYFLRIYVLRILLTIVLVSSSNSQLRLSLLLNYCSVP